MASVSQFPSTWTHRENRDLISEGVLEIGDGYRAKNSEMENDGLPFARAGNVNGGFDFEDADILSAKSVAKAKEKVSQTNDTVITTKGTFGRVAYVKEYTTRFVYSPQLCYWRINDPSVIDPRFLFYWLQGPEFYAQSFQVKSSTDMADYTNLTDQRAMGITAPDLSSQRKIAAILTSYDDLIETNKCRIALLEKMGEELYREWFVRMRFPGHQNTKFVKGVPEGWAPVSVESLVKRIPPGKLYDQKTASPEGAVPILDQGRSGIIGYHNDQPGAKATLDSPLIVFANHTCYQRLIFHSFSAIQNMLPFVPQDEEFDVYWLHFATKDCIQFSEYKGHWPAFMATQVYKPHPKLTTSFGSLAKPILHQVYGLELLNRTLTQTRDLLLPRLISGKLSVEDLDIQFPPSMQEDATEPKTSNA
jgi:type I restriction enzyme, S subunit